MVRMDLNARRIRDLHYAAQFNYPKLLHYARSKKHSHLLWETDAEGNTPLHSAAKGACKRTLKLLLKRDMDKEALNNDGFSPLHLVIMTPAIDRDECCLYMLEHGFDDKQMTESGKSCLLLACEFNRPVVARELLQYTRELATIPLPNIPVTHPHPATTDTLPLTLLPLIYSYPTDDTLMPYPTTTDTLFLYPSYSSSGTLIF